MCDTMDAADIEHLVELDPNVLAKLPIGTKVLDIMEADASLSKSTKRIDTELADGTPQSYFMKHVEDGDKFFEAYYEAERIAYQAVPDSIPRPIGWGQYAADPNTYFYISEYIEFEKKATTPTQWAKSVAALHTATRNKSPGGLFGFPMRTYLAWIAVDNTWNSSWEAFWAQQMRGMFDDEEKLNGPSELQGLRKQFFSCVIPRLLRPLEADGRKIEPCLVHSNLWLGNIKIRSDTKQACLFDFCAFWGHNEADLSICYNPRYKLCTALGPYTDLMGKSEPKADFFGRNALYALKFHLLLSLMYNGGDYQKITITEMKKLIDEYGKEEFPSLEHTPISTDDINVQNLAALKLNSTVGNSADRRTEQPSRVKTSMKVLEDEKRIQVGNMCYLEGSQEVAICEKGVCFTRL